jgi:hypothetical protein
VLGAISETHHQAPAMLRGLTQIMLLALSVLLCACVAPIPSSSIIGLDKASLINQLGKPQHEGIYPEGERWDYSRSLEGIFTYFVYLDSNGIVSRYEQVLSEKNFARIKPGMTKIQVIEIIREAPRHHSIARGRGSALAGFGIGHVDNRSKSLQLSMNISVERTSPVPR